MLSNEQIVNTIFEGADKAKLINEIEAAIDNQEYMIICLMVTNSICGISWSFTNDIIEDAEDDYSFYRYTEEIYEVIDDLLEMEAILCNQRGM